MCAGVIQLVCALLWRKNNNTNDFPMKCSAHNGTWTATSTVGFQVHITVQSMRHSGLDRPGRQTFLYCVHFVGDFFPLPINVYIGASMGREFNRPTFTVCWYCWSTGVVLCISLAETNFNDVCGNSKNQKQKRFRSV